MADPTPVPVGAPAPDTALELLRHAVATLAYRAEKVLRDVPAGFDSFRPSPTSRTPVEVLSHLGDLMEWGERMARGEMRWTPGRSTEWILARERFFRGLARLDAALSEPGAAAYTAVIFQGPVADALTHAGQLAMMRGMCGAPVRPESYARASIRAGRVGAEQEAARLEFDGDASAPRPT
jgi:hypothetical protein